MHGCMRQYFPRSLAAIHAGNAYGLSDAHADFRNLIPAAANDFPIGAAQHVRDFVGQFQCASPPVHAIFMAADGIYEPARMRLSNFLLALLFKQLIVIIKLEVFIQ